MASSLSKRRWVNLRQPAVVDVRCSCRKAKLLSSLFSFSSSSSYGSKAPKPNPESPAKHHHPLSSYYPFSPPSSATTFSTSTTSSSDYHPAKANKAKGNKGGRAAKESVAVVKESRDPYHDFRDSMLQMVVEKDMYSTDDLRDLLHRFLSLNSPFHHDAILRAFSEIWSSLFPPAHDKRPHHHHRRRRQHHRRRSSRELSFSSQELEH